mmetsp:Transcript_9059/g.22788  ORF Transcript_9059/g.22788 Transcript_9059/m.22788 type:complete len:480 (+) Transcript_9059:254-1693(+)
MAGVGRGEGSSGADAAPMLTAAASRGGEGAWASVATLSNTAIGVGVLSFPYAFRLTGLVGGLLLCGAVAALEQFTLNTLVRGAARYRALSYQSVVERCLGAGAGRAGSLLLSLSMIVYLFGSLAAYLILLGDVFPSLVGALVSPGSVWSERWVCVLVPALLAVLPLSLTRSLGALSAVSSLSVVALAYTTAAICFRSAQQVVAHHGAPDVAMFAFSGQSILALPMMAFAFQCHVTVVQIFVELEQRPSFARCSVDSSKEGEQGDEHEPLIPGPTGAELASPARIRGMKNIVAVSMLACLTGYTLVGISGYAAYPKNVASNVLNSFGDDDALLQVARLLMGLNGIVSYPVNLFPCRQALDHLLVSALGWMPDPRASSARHLALTGLLFAGSLGLALLVTDLGVVFQLVGGTAGAAIMFIVPGVVAVQMERQLPGSEGLQERQEPNATRRALRMLPGAFVIAAGVLLLLSTVLQYTVLKGA